MFVSDGEYLWLSELNEAGLIDEVGLFSWFKKAVQAVKTVVLTSAAVITAFLKPAIRFVADVTVTLGGRGAINVGAALLEMRTDENGIYHAKFDCWQAIFGYNDLFDKIFDTATSMRSRKFDFDTDDDGISDYILWAWKGDYLTLGAGAELGIYKRWGLSGEIWVAAKNKAMRMTMTLDYCLNNCRKNIINWQANRYEWWVTGFNCNYQHVDRDDLYATFNVTFEDKDMYEGFKKKWGCPHGWSYNGNVATLSF